MTARDLMPSMALNRLSAILVATSLVSACSSAIKVEAPPSYVPPLRDRPAVVVSAIDIRNEALAAKQGKSRLQGFRVFSRIKIDPSLATIIDRDVRDYAAGRTLIDAASHATLLIRVDKATLYQTDATPFAVNDVVKLLTAQTRYVIESVVSLETIEDGKLTHSCRFEQPVEQTLPSAFTRSQSRAAIEHLLRRYRPLLMATLVDRCEREIHAESHAAGGN